MLGNFDVKSSAWESTMGKINILLKYCQNIFIKIFSILEKKDCLGRGKGLYCLEHSFERKMHSTLNLNPLCCIAT